MSHTSMETSKITDNDRTTCMPIPSKQQERFSFHEILVNASCLTPATTTVVIDVTVAGLTTCDNIPFAYSVEEQCDMGIRMGMCSVTVDAAVSDQSCQIECKCTDGHDKCILYVLLGYSDVNFQICHLRV